MEDLPINNSTPKLYGIILKVIRCIIAYLIIPIFILKLGINFLLLSSASRQIMPFYEERLSVTITSLIMIYIVYIIAVKIFFIIRPLNLKNEFIVYLTFKGWKLEYYKDLFAILNGLNFFLSFFIKVLDYIEKVAYSLLTFIVFGWVTFIVFFFSFLFIASSLKSISGFNVWDSKFFVGLGNSLTGEMVILGFLIMCSLLLTFIFLFVSGIFLLFLTIFFIKLLFPVANNTVDTSDMPISFLKSSINELESFDFSDGFLKKQKKRNQIIELISFVLENFIKIKHKNGHIDYTNVYYVVLSHHLTEGARKDMRFRINGLYEEIDKLCIRINYMNNPDEKAEIMQDLKKYLKIIEDRNLSEISPVEYKITKSNLTDLIVKGATFLSKIM